jgi:hypothetical protein
VAQHDKRERELGQQAALMRFELETIYARVGRALGIDLPGTIEP